MRHAMYALIDPTDDQTFYMGETINIQRRFIEHLTYRGDNLELNARIATLALHGYLCVRRWRWSRAIARLPTSETDIPACATASERGVL